MKAIAKKLADLIKEDNPDLSELQLVKIRFGLEGFLREGVKITAFFLVFSFFGLLREYAVVILCLALLRPFAGGYHAKTDAGCYLVSLLFFAGVLAGAYYVELQPVHKLCLGLGSLLWIILYAPVDHPRTPFREEGRRKRFKVISIVNTVFIAALGFYLREPYSRIVFLSLTATLLMAALGRYVYGRKEPVPASPSPSLPQAESSDTMKLL